MLKNRLIEFLAHKGLSQGKFESITGLSNGFVNNVKDDIRIKSLQKIRGAFPELNTEWLVSGDGEMLLDDEQMNDMQHYERLIDELKEKISSLERDKSNLSRDKEKLEKDKENLERDKDDLRVQRDNLTRDRDDWKRRYDTLYSQFVEDPKKREPYHDNPGNSRSAPAKQKVAGGK